jgi:branched-chain amino acid transport system permease protein
MITIGLLATIVLNGISFSMLLFLLAAGLELMWGVMNIINLAHGSFYMVGAYVGIVVVNFTGSFLLGILAGMTIGAFLGVMTERFFFSHIPDHLQQVLLTFGIVYILADFCKFVWGGNPIGISAPGILSGSITIGGLIFPLYRLFVTLIGSIIAVALWFFQEKTILGAVIRAGVDDKEMISGFGVNINLLNTVVFAFGSLLAGAAGVIGSPILFVYPRVSWDILTLSMMVIVVGGMGSLGGCLIGSLIIGLTDSLSKFFVPEAATVLTFSVMVFFLVLRPSGILGVGKGS